jgi:cytochrome c-type protein NapC
MKRLVAWVWNLVRPLWLVLSRPSLHFSLGFLTIGGFVAGIMFWGGFNTALEFTNTERFCISCHEMRDNVYQELQATIHFTNRSGVRATCPDCHVPHNWTDKIARKMQASKEVWGKIFGTINTRDKFTEKRRELAEHEWARLKANNSLECRNCHEFEYMDFTRQNARGQGPFDLSRERGEDLHRLPQGDRPQAAGAAAAGAGQR